MHPCPAPAARDCAVVELRRYTLHPGQRDALVTLFDREFVETQEAVGMAVLGQFRDLDAPDRFVWLRGFADMQARHAGLQAFYGGPVWARHRDAANATMADADDVYLLRPAWHHAGLKQGDRAPVGTTTPRAGLLDLTVFHLQPGREAEAVALARGPMGELLLRRGARRLAWYVTEPAPNTFTRLPVHEGANVLVGLALFADATAHAAFIASGAWQRDVAPPLAGLLARAPESHRLAPTARSALHA